MSARIASSGCVRRKARSTFPSLLSSRLSAAVLAGVQLACDHSTSIGDANTTSNAHPTATTLAAAKTTSEVSNRSGSSQSLPDPQANAACIPMSADQRERWNIAPGVSACLVPGDLNSLSLSGNCTRGGSRPPEPSCVVVLREYEGKFVQGDALRLIGQPCSSVGCRTRSHAALYVNHPDGLLPILVDAGTPLTCARSKGDSTIRPCRNWTSQPLALAMQVHANGLRLLELPAAATPPNCLRLREVRGQVLAIADPEECVYDASEVIGKAPSPLRAYDNYRGKLLLLRRPAWKFEPRLPFDHGLGDPWGESSPRTILVHHQNPESFPFALLNPNHRELKACGEERWLKDTTPFVGRATTSGAELVIAPLGFSTCLRGI